MSDLQSYLFSICVILVGMSFTYVALLSVKDVMLQSIILVTIILPTGQVDLALGGFPPRRLLSSFAGM